MEEVKYHPIDFDALNKGDSLSPEQLATITNCQVGTTRYQLAVLRLCDQIQRELDDRGKQVTVAVKKGFVCVLTDEEASIHNNRLFSRHRRGQWRSHARNMQVDVSQLSQESRAAHERNLIVNSAVLAAMREAKRVALQSHKRSTPGLPAPADT